MIRNKYIQWTLIFVVGLGLGWLFFSHSSTGKQAEVQKSESANQIWTCSMGAGSDIAMDVAKMTIISSDLQAVVKAIRLSALTVRSIRQNLFWAFVYNVIGIPIAAGVLYPVWGFLLNPMIAGAAMPGHFAIWCKITCCS